MAKPNTAVAVQSNNSLPAAPDFMKQYAGEGAENIANSEVEIPRIKLIQALSPELQEQDDLKQGEFWHTVAEQSLGKSLNIVPLYIAQVYILWNPREGGGGILARADDGVHWSPNSGEFSVKINKGTKTVTWKMAPTVAASRLAEWGTYDPDNDKSQPAATKMYNVVAFLPDFPELSPCVITLQRSAIKVARRFLGKLKITRAPSYGQVFTVSSTQEQGDQGPYWNYKLSSNGFVTDENAFNHYRGLYEQFKETGVKIKDIEGAGDDDTGSTNAPDTGGEY